MEMVNKGTKKIKVLVITGPLEMGVMIRDVLCELGFDAWAENEGRNDEVDVVILPSDSIGLKLLEKWDESQLRRAVKILWLIDPLPPPGLSARARLIGDRLAKLDWRRLLPGGWGQIVHKHFPFGRDVLRLGRWNCIRRLRKESAREGNTDYIGCNNREWVRVMVRGYRLQECMRDGCIDYLFTTTEAKHRFIVEMGYDAQFIPFGYHRSLGAYRGLERDIDVLFLGRLNSKTRETLLTDLRAELSVEGVRLQIVDNDCYGAQRTELLNRTKISIDLPRVPWDFAIERFLISMSCGAMVVSVGTQSTEPFKAGVHFVQTQPREMAGVILSYLRDERRWTEISRAGYEFVTKEITLKKSVTELLIRSGLLNAG